MNNKFYNLILIIGYLLSFFLFGFFTHWLFTIYPTLGV